VGDGGDEKGREGESISHFLDGFIPKVKGTGRKQPAHTAKGMVKIISRVIHKHILLGLVEITSHEDQFGKYIFHLRLLLPVPLLYLLPVDEVMNP
jgi:hypothetical protein